MKKYPTTVSPQTLIEESKKYLQTYQLDEALSIINRSLLQSQLNEGTDLSINGQILWCKILLTKGRFSGEETISKLALNKLEDCHRLYIASNNSAMTPLPLMTLLTKAHYQIGDTVKAQQLAQQLLLFSKTTNYTIGKIEAYNLLGQITLLRQYSIKALTFARKAQELLIQDTQILNPAILATNYELLCDIFLHQKEYKQAAIYARKVLQLVKENKLLLKEEPIKAHITLGTCALHLHNHTIALSHLLEAKELSTAIGQKQLIAASLLQQAILYNKVQYSDGALKCLETIATKFEGVLKNNTSILLFHNTWGQTLYDAHQLEEARAHFEIVQQLANPAIEKSATIIALVHLSAIHTAKKEFKKALFLAKKANEYIEDIAQDTKGQALNLINLGNIHYQLGKFSEAIKLTSRGITTAKRQQEEHNEIRGYQLMSLILQRQKNYKNALIYQTIYTKFFEDFFQRNERQVLSNFEAAFTIQALKRRSK